jgi:calcineurin-like phosphoesterase family protein
MDAIKHFNDFLSENGVNVLYGSFYANYNGKIIDELVNGNNDKLDETYERLFDKPKYVTKRNRKNYETTNYIII